MREGVRERIRKCNERKATLFAEKDKYSKEYFERRCREYDRYLRWAHRRCKLEKFGARALIVLSFIVFVLLILFLWQNPQYMGFLAG